MIAALGNVLIVDNDSTSSYLSSRMLEKMQAAQQVAVANSICEALRLVKTGCFDLMLLDNHMPAPEGSGLLESLQELQEEAAIQVPAVVIISSSENCMGSDSVYTHHVKGYLVKPLTEEQVRFLIYLTSEEAH
jgi:CheY-like chemotaxis protein